MIKIEIIPESNLLATLQARLKEIGSASLPATVDAFKQGVKIIQSEWKSYAMGAQIPGTSYKLKNPTGGYAAGIKARNDGPFDYTIYNDSLVAHALEEGTPQLDMKTTHPYGQKGRVANHGTKNNPRWVPYLIVPFRWGTPRATGGHFRNIIPEQIYAMLQLQIKAGVFTRTKVLPSTHTEPNFWGEQVQRAEYEGEDERGNWGSILRGIGGDIEGMSVMAANTAKKRSSTYFTFRVISAESPAGSWIKPATPAMHIAQHVADNVRNVVEEMIQDGLKVDLGVQ
jgi:hypothetical protein